MGAGSKIARFLPNNEYQAAISANAPTALNPFATMADLSGLGENMANADLILSDHRTHDGNGFDYDFSNLGEYILQTAGLLTLESDGGIEIKSTSGDLLIQTITAGNNIVFDMQNNGAIVLPLNTDPTVNVTTPLSGMLSYNSTSDEPEYYNGTSWVSLAGGGGGGNTIYTANDSLVGDRTVGMGAFKLSLSGTGKMFVGAEVGTAKFNVDNGTGTGFTTSFSRDFDAGVGLNGHLFTTNPRGSEVRKVRTNGTAFSIFNEWTIGSSRKSFDFIASVNNNYLSVFQSTNGTTENVRIGEIDSWWVPRNTTAFGFAFGHTSPTAGTVHLDNLDLKVEGTTDVNLLITDFSTNQLSIGSTPYANVKASITNAEAQTYSFLVLNQATTQEFGVMETGVVYTNGQLSISMGTSPTSSADLIMNGDIETATTGWIYFGDAGTDGSWRMSPNGGSDFLHQRREVGVWVTKQTITP